MRCAPTATPSTHTRRDRRARGAAPRPGGDAGAMLVEALVALVLIAFAGLLVASAAANGLRATGRAATLGRTTALASRELALLANRAATATSSVATLAATGFPSPVTATDTVDRAGAVATLTVRDRRRPAGGARRAHDAAPAPGGSVSHGDGGSGCTLVELLVGMAIGLVGAAALTALLRVGVAAGTRAGADAATASEAAAAVDQLTRDVRVAGYDPAGAGIAAFTVVAPDRLEVQADLDGNGVIDASSEERVGWRVAASSRSLQRVVGSQSLPILSDVGTSGLRLAYFDAAGAELDPTSAATKTAARAVTIDLATLPTDHTPGARLHGGARLVNR